MTLEELYDGIKNALNFFGLSWHEKGLVSVCIAGDSLVYTYMGQSIKVQMPTAHAERKPLPIPRKPRPL